MAKLLVTQTSDIHGFIFSTDYVNSKDWGMSKIYNKINNLNRQFDFKLNIDTGDFIQGSPLAFFLEEHFKQEEFKQEEKKEVCNLNKSSFPMITELLNVADVDVFTLGNHEFNFGQKYLNLNLNKIQGDILCANIENLNENILPFKIFSFDDLKIGVIGLTTSYIPNWEKSRNIENLIFNNPINVYKKYEEELKKSCDIIIVNYHGGLELDLESNSTPTELLTKENQGSELIKTFDSIDILLTGHQHRQIARKINDTIVMQPMNNGQCFSKIVIDTKSKVIESFELIPVTSADHESELINTFFSHVNKKCNNFLDKILTTLPKDLKITNVESARLNGHIYANFINSIFCKIMDTEISCMSLFDSAIGFEKDLTIRQIILNYPFPNNLVKVNLTGKEIIEAIKQSSNYYTLSKNKNLDNENSCKENLDVNNLDSREIIINPKYLTPKLKSFNYDLFYGVDYKIIVGENENTITDVKINGNPIYLEKEYSICINNYRYTTFEEFPVYKDKKIVKESDKDVITLLCEYFSNATTNDLTFDQNINFSISQ